MIYIVSTLSILLFLVFFVFLKIVSKGKQAIRTCKMAVDTFSNPDLEDEEKEKIIQRASIDLFKIFFSIVFRSLASLALSIVPIWLFDTFNWVKMEETFSFLSRWDVLIIAFIITTIMYLILRTRSCLLK